MKRKDGTRLPFFTKMPLEIQIRMRTETAEAHPFWRGLPGQIDIQHSDSQFLCQKVSTISITHVQNFVITELTDVATNFLQSGRLILFCVWTKLRPLIFCKAHNSLLRQLTRFYFRLPFSSPKLAFPSVSVCLVVRCPLLRAPSNGAIVTQQASPAYRDLTTLSCNVGYALSGSARRTCQANGTWSGSSTVCNRKLC